MKGEHTIMKDIIGRVFIKHIWALAVKKTTEKKYTILKNPWFKFRADPFVVETDKDIFVYFEDFNFFLNRGSIFVGVLNERKSKIEKVRPVLGGKHHFSYPCIIREKNNIFLVPETAEKKEISLYQIVKLPDQIKKRRILLDNIDAVDSTLYYHKDRWYLFTNTLVPGTNKHNQLRVFFTDDLYEGQFKPVKHISMAKTPLSNGRMAGNIHQRNSSIIRYSQDCTHGYGDNININEVLELSPERYKEKFVNTISKPDKTFGMHTINKGNRITVTDFKIRTLNPLTIFLVNMLSLLKMFRH